MYSIVDFAQSVDADRCRIQNTPNFIFLCGGPTAKTGPYRSARHYLYRHLLSSEDTVARRVKLAEDVNAWFHPSVFPDLLELEHYLADLADIIVLFVESPGSIAELGAFAASDDLREKTLVVLNSHYALSGTFISDGPVLKIKNESGDLVHHYRWDPRQLHAATSARTFRRMATNLTEVLAHRNKTRKEEPTFVKTSLGHKLLLIADLIGMARAVTSTEIAKCIEQLGCKVELAELHRHLSLLQSMSFIKRVERPKQTFYLSRPRRFIRYRYKPNVKEKDRQRIMSMINTTLKLEPARRNIVLKFFDTLPMTDVPHV